MSDSSKHDVRVCLLSGNYHYRESIKSKIKEKLGDFELSIYDSQCTYEYVVSQIFAPSCFSGHRLIIINDWPKIQGKHVSLIAKFKKMVADIPHDCLVILDNLPNVTDKFIERIGSVGKTFIGDNYVKRYKANSWTIKEISKISKKIEEVDADLLVESVGASTYGDVEIDRLLLTIKKLCHFVGNKKIITHDDVLAVCFDSSEFIIWTLFNHLDEKDITKCLSMGKKAIINQSNMRYSIEGFFSLIIWRYKLILCLKDQQRLGWKNDKIIYDISQFRKFKREGSFLKTKMKVDKTMYSERAINVSMYKGSRKVCPLGAYSRRELYKIIKSSYIALLKIRMGCSQSQLLILWYGFYMVR